MNVIVKVYNIFDNIIDQYELYNIKKDYLEYLEESYEDQGLCVLFEYF